MNTDEDVRIYLEERSEAITGDGGVAMPVGEFWRPGDLERYNKAREVWATDAPPICALPDLPTMLNGIAGPVGAPLRPFMADLEALWTRYTDWCRTEDRDPLHPKEDRRQRQARRARESVRLARERRRPDVDPDRAQLLARDRELYDAYMAACRRRKTIVAELDAEVSAAKAAYDSIHAQVKG